MYDKEDRYIVNGAHDCEKLQSLLDGFIKRFVLCPNCDNPETALVSAPATVTDRNDPSFSECPQTKWWWDSSSVCRMWLPRNDQHGLTQVDHVHRQESTRCGMFDEIGSNTFLDDRFHFRKEKVKCQQKQKPRRNQRRTRNPEQHEIPMKEVPLNTMADR